MSTRQPTRRDFVKTAAVTGAVAGFPTIVPSSVFGQDAPNSRIQLGFIGVGSRGNSHVNGMSTKPGIQPIAACDVDSNYLQRAKNTIEQKLERVGRPGKCDTYHEYEELVARSDIDAIVCTTPDHWHTKIVVEAMQSGKDVYCEKPLTLTIDEGKVISQVTKETKRVFQVGTQQRSGRQFISTVAAVRNGLIGKVKRVVCSIGGGPKGGPFPVEKPPETLDWDRWQGQTPVVEYRRMRCHYQFRWWYEYSGGKMTDWGAHHVDIAQWGIGQEHTGPTRVEPILVEHPVPFNKSGNPTKDDSYNTATKFQTRATFANGVEMIIRNDAHDYDDPKLRGPRNNGIWFEGEKGDIFVNRGGGSGLLNGKRPDISKEALAKVYKTDMNPDHYGNWFHCMRNRTEPVSDVWSHHRILSTCHLANIANRLNRSIVWDPKKEVVVGDELANSMIRREQRAPYQVKVKSKA